MRLSAGLIIIVLASPLVAVEGISAATSSTCFGETATIVSNAGEVTGTRRSDVISAGSGFSSVYGFFFGRVLTVRIVCVAPATSSHPLTRAGLGPRPSASIGERSQ